MNVPESVKKDILLFQNLQNQAAVLQNEIGRMDLEIAVLTDAINVLEESTEEHAYKIIGPVMIREKREKLLKELEERKENFEVRKKALEKKLKQMNTQLLELKNKIERELSKVENIGQGSEVS